MPKVSWWNTVTFVVAPVLWLFFYVLLMGKATRLSSFVCLHFMLRRVKLYHISIHILNWIVRDHKGYGWMESAQCCQTFMYNKVLMIFLRNVTRRGFLAWHDYQKLQWKVSIDISTLLPLATNNHFHHQPSNQKQTLMDIISSETF